MSHSLLLPLYIIYIYPSVVVILTSLAYWSPTLIRRKSLVWILSTTRSLVGKGPRPKLSLIDGHNVDTGGVGAEGGEVEGTEEVEVEVEVEAER